MIKAATFGRKLLGKARARKAVDGQAIPVHRLLRDIHAKQTQRNGMLAAFFFIIYYACFLTAMFSADDMKRFFLYRYRKKTVLENPE